MMSQSRQFAVLEAVVRILGDNAAGAWRCRFRDFDVKELPADNIIPESITPEYADNVDVERTFHFHVRHTAAAVDGASQPVDGADRAADARYVRAQKLLMADRSLGGTVRDGSLREVGQKWEMERGTLQLIALVVTYQVEFSTKINDPSQAGY